MGEMLWLLFNEQHVSGFANGSGNFIYGPQLWRVVAWR